MATPSLTRITRAHGARFCLFIWKFMTAFTELGLSEPILRSVAQCGYDKPTPIQEKAIPHALEGRDLLLSAQTGSGKTAAYVLPMLELLNQQPVKMKKTRALILTPTRELAQQVQQNVREFTKNFNWLFSIPLVGGAPYGGQIRALKKGIAVVIATPGRLCDHLREGNLDLSNIQYLVLDEADRMLDMGFADDIKAIIDACPAERQTIMGSATWDGAIGHIAAGYTHNAEKIVIKPETKHIAETVFYTDDQAHKNAVLERLTNAPEMEQCIVFTATKRSAEQVSDELYHAGHRARFLHGDLPQNRRNRIVDDLRKGKLDILVATDVAARGIDIPHITHVINYDLPRQSEDYVHRIGRSGRAGRSGIAWSLVSLPDRAVFAQLQRYLKRDIQTDELEGLEPKKVAPAKVHKPKRRGASNKSRRFSKDKPSSNNRRRADSHRANAPRNAAKRGNSNGRRAHASRASA